jgi:hypothetical protein
MNRAVRSTLECVWLDAALESPQGPRQSDRILNRCRARDKGGVKPHALHQGAAHIGSEDLMSEPHEQEPMEPLRATTAPATPTTRRLPTRRRKVSAPSPVPRHYPTSFIGGYSRGHERATRQANGRCCARSTVTTPALSAPPLLNQVGSPRARQSDPSSDLVPRPPSPLGRRWLRRAPLGRARQLPP